MSHVLVNPRSLYLGQTHLPDVSQVLADPHPMAETVLVNSEDWPAAAVAIMNVVYAFSGQSAYVEIIAEMKGPHRSAQPLSLPYLLPPPSCGRHECCAKSSWHALNLLPYSEVSAKLFY